MTGNRKSGSPAASDDDYEVGYGRPPKATRFQPGRSGNPSGRPKGASGRDIAALAEEPLKQMLRKEAYREVTVNDASGPLKLTMLEANVRSLGVSGAKGNTRAARFFLESVAHIEEQDKRSYDEHAQFWIEYKTNWTAILEHRKQFKIEGPDPIPHPDHIVIGADGILRIIGPTTPEEKVVWDKLQCIRGRIVEAIAETQDNLNFLRNSTGSKTKSHRASRMQFEAMLLGKQQRSLKLCEASIRSRFPG